MTAINSSKLHLESIFDGKGSPKEINEALSVAIARISHSDSILLDAYACRALLAHPHLIPNEWSSLADSDWAGGGACIRFDGSIFENTDSKRKVVLAPSVSGGRWSYSFTDRYEQESQILGLEVLNVRVFTVTLRA